jgi:hypothetical protein
MRMPLLLCLSVLCSCVHQSQPLGHADRNLQLLTQYYQHASNRDHAAQAAMWAAQGMNLGKPTNPEGIRVSVEDIHRTFPDYASVPIETRAVGDTVVQLSRMSGTHRGVAQTGIFGGLLEGAVPTGRHFEVLVTHWWRFDDSGKIVWHEVTRDDLGMYRQLGLLPETLPTDKRLLPVKD